MRDHIRFLLNSEEVTARPGATDTLLDWLRLDRGLTGTKEGCAEGDCGACTVLVGRRSGSNIRYEPVNACIRFLASVDLCHVVTVEHLGTNGLHPVQSAMVDHHASQCGFCTPGIVMALSAWWLDGANPDRTAIETALQGNLCRCTGYAPIVRAAEAAAEVRASAAEPLADETEEIAQRLTAMAGALRVETGPADNRAILPSDVDDLANVLEAQPGATVVAGATDVGLWVTKQMRQISPAVFIGHLDALRQIEDTPDGLRVGAVASYAEAIEALAARYPHLTEYWNRIGGAQVRAMGTVGGNIANGSPIGDTPPVLIAMAATLVLRQGAKRRRMALEDFFLKYGRQDRAAGEFVEAIEVPPDPAGAMHAAYKISKRRDEDISSVAAGFRIIERDGRIVEARLAFGGMAGTPKRAASAEAALTGEPMENASFEAAAAALTQDFVPLTDWRASAEYRMQVAQNLLRRLWLECSGQTARLKSA
ncbi:MAG: xanthine dehydrogenase small subunit [Pseudomonadota bacterium]